jgi:competence ComEA-like helix-hairpin-helix protein
MADTLQGIGLKSAEAIIAYRNRFGKFYSAEELTDIIKEES